MVSLLVEGVSGIENREKNSMVASSVTCDDRAIAVVILVVWVGQSNITPVVPPYVSVLVVCNYFTSDWRQVKLVVVKVPVNLYICRKFRLDA